MQAKASVSARANLPSSLRHFSANIATHKAAAPRRPPPDAKKLPRIFCCRFTEGINVFSLSLEDPFLDSRLCLLAEMSPHALLPSEVGIGQLETSLSPLVSTPLTWFSSLPYRRIHRETQAVEKKKKKKKKEKEKEKKKKRAALWPFSRAETLLAAHEFLLLTHQPKKTPLHWKEKENPPSHRSTQITPPISAPHRITWGKYMPDRLVCGSGGAREMGDGMGDKQVKG
jgi:hypothetical protein